MWDLLLSGGTRVIYELANRLLQKGHKVTITSLKGRETSWFPIKVEVKCLHSIVQRAINYGFQSMNMDTRLDFVQFLAKHLPDCDINVGTFYPTAFAVHRSGRGVPIYYAQHYEPLIIDDPYEKKLAEEIYCLPIDIIAVSTWIGDAIYKNSSKKVVVALNGVNLDVFYPRRIEQAGEKKMVLCRPSNIPWKGFVDLIEAMKMVNKARSDVELVMFTAERLDPALINQITFPSRIVKSPSDEQVARLYSLCDLFVSSSWYEGFHMPPLEAMACGTPVVTTDCHGGVSDYAENEVNSLVVPSKDPKSLSSAILRILSDRKLAEDLGKNAINTSRRFTWDKTTSIVEEFFSNKLKNAS